MRKIIQVLESKKQILPKDVFKCDELASKFLYMDRFQFRYHRRLEKDKKKNFVNLGILINLLLNSDLNISCVCMLINFDFFFSSDRGFTVQSLVDNDKPCCRYVL